MAKVTVGRADVLRWMKESAGTPRDAAKKFGINENTIKSWELRDRRMAGEAATPKRRARHADKDLGAPIHMLPPPLARPVEADVRENIRAAIRKRAARLADDVDPSIESPADSARILKILTESFDLTLEKTENEREDAAPDLSTPEGEAVLLAQIRKLPRHLVMRALQTG